MSEEALHWVVEAAPDVSPHWIPVLVGLARHADTQGRGAYPSQELLAEYARKSDRAVRNDLKALEKAGLIRPGDPSLVEHFPPDRRPLVWDLAVEWRRALQANDWKPTSGRSTVGNTPKKTRTRRSERNDRKPTSTRSTGRKPTSTRSTVGNTSQEEQNRRSERNDRKPTSTRTDRKHTSTRSDAIGEHKTAGQRGTTGSPLPTKLSNYVGKQAAQHGVPIPSWAQPLIDELAMKGVTVGWGRMSHFQWIAVQQLIKSHGVAYLAYIAGTRWNPKNPIKFGTLLIDIWHEYPPPPVGSPWHPDARAARAKNSRPVELPPHCGHIDCDEISRLRDREDGNGLRSSAPCPECHPDRKDHAA